MGKAKKLIKGYKEHGFLPEAVVNFLSLLGWNPGNEKELFDIKELIESFSLKDLNKSEQGLILKKTNGLTTRTFKKQTIALLLKKLKWIF